MLTGLLLGYPGATTVRLEEGVRNPQDVWVPGGEREAEPRIEQGLIGSEGRILEGLEERKPSLGVLGFSSSMLSLLVHNALVGGGCKCTHFIWG